MSPTHATEFAAIDNAVLGTLFVISVHSVVSWNFALGIIPGWHSTILSSG